MFACFSMASTHEGYFQTWYTNMFLFYHKPILKLGGSGEIVEQIIVHETWENRHMKTRPLGQHSNKDYMQISKHKSDQWLLECNFMLTVNTELAFLQIYLDGFNK
jgi:predicted metal-dependent RNase